MATKEGLPLAHVPTRVIEECDGPELDVIATVPTHEVPFDMERERGGNSGNNDDSPLYDRFTARRKAAITAMLCLSSFLG